MSSDCYWFSMLGLGCFGIYVCNVERVIWMDWVVVKGDCTVMKGNRSYKSVCWVGGLYLSWVLRSYRHETSGNQTSFGHALAQSLLSRWFLCHTTRSCASLIASIKPPFFLDLFFWVEPKVIFGLPHQECRLLFVPGVICRVCLL